MSQKNEYINFSKSSSKEIETEMKYHIDRWGSSYSNLNSINRWKQNLTNFKNTLTTRYNRVTSNLKSYFNLLS